MGIVNRNGALWMATGVDNSGLYSGLNQAEGRIDQFGAHVGNVGNQIAKLTGIGFGVAGLKSFGSEIINVRGEMQMLESSFEVLLGGKGVSGFMSEMKQFAVDSPLSLTGVSNAAQTLLGFNIEAENVVSIIKQIGDISMGNEQRFNSLILAFAQMSSTGKLMGQDLNQMINAGFNPLQEMSEKTGKSISKLKKEMESGAISSQMVADAFSSATAEGGKFYGMTQKQAEGIQGLKAQLEGSLQDAFNDLGKSQDNIITGGYKVAISLVENYEKVGKVIIGLIATYGAYRTAVVLNTIAVNGLTTAEGLHKIAVLASDKAHKILKATMLSNPLVAVTYLVIGLTTTMWTLKDSLTATEKAQANYNKTKEEAIEKEKAHKSQIEELITTSTNQALADLDRAGALEELKNKYPEIFSKYDIETIKLADILKLKKEIAEIDSEKAVDNRRQLYEKALEEVRKAEQALADAKEAPTMRHDRTKRAQARLDRARANLIPFEEDVAKDNINAFISNLGQMSKAQIEIELNTRKKLEQQLKKTGDNKAHIDSGGLMGLFNKDQIQQQTEALEKELNKRNETRYSYVNLEKKYNKELQELIAQRQQIQKSEDTLTEKEINSKLKELDDKIEVKQKQLKDLTGKSPSDHKREISETDKARKQAQDIIDQNERLLLLEKRQGVERQRAEEDLQNKATQASIDAMQDGAEKKAKQRDLDNKLELQAIDRQKEDYVQAIIQAQRELFDIQEELAVKKGEKKEKGVFKADPTGVDTSFFDSVKNDTTVKQTKEQLESLLSVYKDYEARKKEINDNYDADLTSLESRYTEAQTEQEKAKIAAAIVELKKQWSKALSTLNLEEFQDSIDWSTVFGNLDKVSTEEMVKLRDKLKEYLSSVGDSLSPQDLKTVTDAFENLDEKIANVKPIQGVIDGYNEYRSAVDDVAKSKEKLAKLEKGTDAYVEATKELTDAEKKRRDSLVKMSQSINSIGQKGTALVNSMGELMGMFEKFGVEFPESIKEGLEGVGQMMSGLESLDLTKPMSVITSSVSIVSGLGSTIAGLFGSSDQLTQATIDSYNRYMSTVDKLIAKQKELLESVSGTDAVVLANQARESVQRQIDATQKIASDWLSSKSGGKYSGGNWRGADKVISNYKKELQALGHDISSAQYDLITLSPEELEKIRNDLPKMWADFDSDFSEWLNTIIDLGETMEEIAKKEKERLTGLSFDSLKNSFDDLLKSADTTFEDIGNSFEDHMRNAVLNFVKSKYLTDALKDWYNEFAKAYDDDELSKSEVEQLRKMYEEAYNKAQGLYDSALDVIGVDKENEAQREGAQGGFMNASQESVNEYLGVLYGVRQIQGDIRNINLDLRENSTRLNEMVLDMRAVVNDNNQILQDSLDYQSQIAANTFRTAEILDAIETYGLKLK